MPTPSRIAASRALHAVFGSGHRVSDRWDLGLSTEDAGLAQALLGLCLRHWGRLQAYVKPKLKDQSRNLPLGSQVALAIGFAQLAWMDGVAAHAAVNEAVELAADPGLGFPPHRGLVNALLRRGAENRQQLRAHLDALPASLDRTPFVDAVLEAALEPHHAAGKAQIEALWAKLQVPPHPAFRVLRGDAPPELDADPHLEGCWSLREGAAFPGPWLQSGAGMVQDRSSQALMAFHWEGKPAHILDACAAPGGKTTSLGLRFPDARITAVEREPRRAERLKKNLADRGVKAAVVVAEVTDFLANTTGTFDLIVLDAPCSGSGTLQKHPELPWIAGNIDLERLSEMQRELLRATIPKLEPGGLLIYAVCSWLPEEGEHHRAWMRAANAVLQPAPIWAGEYGAEIGTTSCFRPHPLKWEGEGFQAFAWTKR
ncbi:MAG: RsmB/NOP family class I SAM-dependent RNA methyltransferase [Holophagaceae bacterium]|nr:RsmB/NOP family class I SAM-dependent RNA methyltransferase [Holophagaceae bacterium]